jgi:1-deoxy-D-xylulose-5-phosphate synthase
VLARHGAAAGAPAVLIVSIGAMAGTALETGELLAAHGLRVTVVDPRWALPVPSALVKLAGEHDHVVTLEDGVVDGGIGAALAQRARAAGLSVAVQAVGVPLAFLAHATTEQLVTELRLRPEDIARDVLTALGTTR